MDMIRNETLYNLTLESPLLRDADILDGRIMETWRGPPSRAPLRVIGADWIDAAIKKGREVNAMVLEKVRGSEATLRVAEGNLERCKVLLEESEALRTLGDNVL
jgi:hypothetical protein